MNTNLLPLEIKGDSIEDTFKANAIINLNLKQLNSNISLLPESQNHVDIEDMSFLKYLSHVNKLIYKNSQLIGFDYPLIEDDFSFAYEAVKKVYEPIADYFKSIEK